MREPDNSHDSNAVAIYVEGQQVGYLSREDAITFRPLRKEVEARGEVATCAAVVVGGWDRGARGQGNFGVRLKPARPGRRPPLHRHRPPTPSGFPTPWSGC